MRAGGTGVRRRESQKYLTRLTVEYTNSREYTAVRDSVSLLRSLIHAQERIDIMVMKIRVIAREAHLRSAQDRWSYDSDVPSMNPLVRAVPLPYHDTEARRNRTWTGRCPLRWGVLVCVSGRENERQRKILSMLIRPTLWEQPFHMWEIPVQEKGVKILPQ